MPDQPTARPVLPTGQPDDADRREIERLCSVFETELGGDPTVLARKITALMAARYRLKIWRDSETLRQMLWDDFDRTLERVRASQRGVRMHIYIIQNIDGAPVAAYLTQDEVIAAVVAHARTYLEGMGERDQLGHVRGDVQSTAQGWFARAFLPNGRVISGFRVAQVEIGAPIPDGEA